jgi:molybdate transport system substrate-binding protein
MAEAETETKQSRPHLVGNYKKIEGINMNTALPARAPRLLLKGVLIAAITIANALAFPASALAQVKVIMSGGFTPPYRVVLPEFERTTGISVTTASGASQGKGPETIGAQLHNGLAADVVIMSKEGLQVLVEEGRVVAGSMEDLAQTPVAVAVRVGAAKPDISTVDALKKTLLAANTIALPGSTSGIYLANDLFPRLGVPAKSVKVTARGAQAAAMVRAGEADMAIQPLSELMSEAGIVVVGNIPQEVQFISVFSAAVLKGAKDGEAARRLIAFLASDKAAAAIKAAGMEPANVPAMAR